MVHGSIFRFLIGTYSFSCIFEKNITITPKPMVSRIMFVVFVGVSDPKLLGQICYPPVNAWLPR